MRHFGSRIGPILALHLFLSISSMDKVQATSNPLPEFPTIVLVPGAWHSPVHYELLFSQLSLSGWPTISDRLPSCGSTDPQIETVAGDADYIRETLLLPQIDAGKDVVLVMHSYGDVLGLRQRQVSVRPRGWPPANKGVLLD